MEELDSESQSATAAANSANEEENNPTVVVDNNNSAAKKDSIAAQHRDHADVLGENTREESEAIDQSGKNYASSPGGNNENALPAVKSQSSALMKNAGPASVSIGLF